MRKQITLSVDPELFDAAKSKKFNLSAILREALRNELNYDGDTRGGRTEYSKDVNELFTLRNELDKLVTEGTEVLGRLNGYCARWEANVKKKNTEMVSLFDSMPELQGLSEEHLLDSKFLGDLVDAVNQKYSLQGFGRIRASINSIREYYSLKSGKQEQA